MAENRELLADLEWLYADTQKEERLAEQALARAKERRIGVGEALDIARRHAEKKPAPDARGGEAKP